MADAMVMGGIVGFMMGIIHLSFNYVFPDPKIAKLKTDNASLQEQIDDLSGLNVDATEDIMRLNRELTKAHDEIETLKQKLSELRQSYAECRTTAEDFVKLFREKHD